MTTLDSITMNLGGCPPGVVGVLLAPKGNPVAAHAEFDQTHPAGLTLVEAQEIRLLQQIAKSVIDGYYSQPMPAIDTEDAARLLRHLVDRSAFRLVVIRLGHAEG